MKITFFKNIDFLADFNPGIENGLQYMVSSKVQSIPNYLSILNHISLN